MSKLEEDVRYAKGIGEQRAKILNKLGVYTLQDLLSYFPRDYQDRSVIRSLAELEDGESACVKAVAVNRPVLARIRKGMELVKFRIADETAAAEVTFFNQSYVKNQIASGGNYLFYGRFQRSGTRLELLNPVFEKAERAGSSTGRIVPIYRLSAGLSQKVLSKAIEQALEELSDRLPDLLPEEIRQKYGLMDCRQAYRDIHFPATLADARRARERLVFEELFVLACGLGRMKVRRRERAARVIPAADPAAFFSSLPFQLTGAQERAVRQALEDMACGSVMNRLVQGDVGSGKTVVAAACIWAAKQAGFQAAFMAPTELLADQHADTLDKMLAPFGIRTVLLKGSMRAAQKRSVREALAFGEADLVVGTHAILSEGVEFRDLALVITDEQHRFGVEQRAALAAKSSHPHVLVMSATPIPRTLALIIYGDVDVSIIDELPPGRQKVDTFAVDEGMRPRINRFIARLVGEGRQVYVVCPMIGDDEQTALDLKSARELHRRLQEETFPELKVTLLHGRMKAAEKEAVMAAFAAGETDILVATTVIEVGVDVPNAALMVVENAERFGLSQLHQLRGRVGRGQHKSYCVLFQGSEGGDSRTRLEIMTRLSDGFRISEEDLKLRGPGDFFGSRQHGLPQLQVADLASSLDVLAGAQREAAALLEKDPELDSMPQLQQRVECLFREKLSG